MTTVVERFLKYVKIDTRSDEDSTTVPSTAKQLNLARELVKEMEEMGLKNVSLDDNGYVMAELPSNIDKDVPVIGFIAHMDTSPDMTGENVNPQIVKNYDGGDIILNKDQNVVLSPSEFPELRDYVGQDLITTDGTTLLGADDKAGIAGILSAMEYLIAHPEIKHGTIKIGFTPDEEVGRGADHFDVEKFGADLAYTVDGGRVGELEYESFNAAAAKIKIKGRNVHPGYAAGKMVNSILIANEIVGSFPADEVPEKTAGYDGFYHLNSIHGEVEETNLHYIIRDFSRENFERRKQFVVDLVEKMNKKYGEGTVILDLNDQYYNMKEKIDEVKYIVDIAFEAMEAVGVKPIVRPIRGGTDGSRLSFMGLPTPNIFAGGENFHGKYEYVPIQSLEKVVEVIVKISELFAER
ncbi:MAG: peptidase T [Clostridiales bacterium]|uniref:peptidase T n=1 Tax=Clostridium sp. N3C TaxID=1776758 RepID=UPI00092E166B|nr:peptidase T [Clostridium sp. N3C]NLZ47973.1 peptidase T [Clostridiales bacterium]SCN24454.1 Peptidase T [Clostridium sp. N3C]